MFERIRDYLEPLIGGLGFGRRPHFLGKVKRPSDARAHILAECRRLRPGKSIAFGMPVYEPAFGPSDSGVAEKLRTALRDERGQRYRVELGRNGFLTIRRRGSEGSGTESRTAR
jgi:hypothetical protein